MIIFTFYELIKYFIFSAAHCLVSQNKGRREVLIKLGTFNVFNWTEPHQRVIQVKETIIHPDYNMKYQHNDIALIKFSNIEYTQFIKPVCIWSGDRNLGEVVGVKATVCEKIPISDVHREVCRN